MNNVKTVSPGLGSRTSLSRMGGLCGMAAVLGAWSCGGSEFETCEKTRTCPESAAGAAGEPNTGGSSGRASGGASGSAAETSASSGGVNSSGASTAGGGTSSTAGPTGQGGETAASTTGDVALAGAGGEATEPECLADADCSDQLFCNGEELCVGGACLPGTDPCLNPDAEFCLVECVEAQHQCQVSAVDADADGFGSTACLAAPGADCDDANDAIHTEATEVCDSIDNDCDSLVDLMDGLPLAGTTQVLAAGDSVALDWSPMSNQFGAVYIDRESAGYLGALGFGTLGAGGEVTGGTILIGPSSGEFQMPSMAWGGARYGVVYMVNNQQNHEFYFVTLAASGVPSTLATTVGDDPHDITYRTAGDWLIPLKRVTSTGVRIDFGQNPSGLVTGPTLDVAAHHIRVGSHQATSALVGQLEGTTSVQWLLLAESLDVSLLEELSAEGAGPDIVGTSNGYAVAWASAEGLAFQRFDGEGVALCEPASVPFGDGELAQDDQVRLAMDGELALVLMTEASVSVGLFRFDDTCQLIDEALLTEEADAPGSPSIATGGGQVALAWTDTAEPDSSLTRQARTRRVSTLLCE